MYRLLAYLLILILVTGCSTIPPADDGFVAYTISHRTNSEVEWRQGSDQEEQVVKFIECSVANELDADTAIQIALLNNPKIQAVFEELGIARADLVEAGLLSNPSYEIEIRYPHVRHLKTNIEYLITTSLLDIFLVPLRTRLARTEFEQVKLKVSNEILDVAFEVKKTYYELIGERKKAQYIQSVYELTSILSEISSKQIAVGNVNSLEFQLAKARLLEAQLELSRSQAEIIRLEEKLTRLLGFTEAICFILPDSLPEVDDYRFDLGALENVALQERLDLQVARYELARLSQMLGLKESWSYTNLRAGLAGEREPDGANLLGPGFSGELPVFNYGQAARMRVFAQLRQASDRLAELEIKVLSEVREAHKLIMSYLDIINNYRRTLLPMQATISDSSEQLYNVMGLGIDKLLENKRQEIVTSQNYVESLKEYLVARVELDHALGGFLYKLTAQGECLQGVSDE